MLWAHSSSWTSFPKCLDTIYINKAILENCTAFTATGKQFHALVPHSSETPELVQQAVYNPSDVRGLGGQPTLTPSEWAEPNYDL